MSKLTERTTVDKYEIVGEFNLIHLRHATVIERDGVEVSRTFHRTVIVPGDDVTGASPEVQALVALMHPEKVASAYAVSRDSVA
jgi:hypothetical protein